MTIVDHFQRNIMMYTLVGMAAACLFIASYTFQPWDLKRRINNMFSNGQPTLYERVMAAADMHGNANAQPDPSEMIDILQRAGYILSFDKDKHLVAERGAEKIVYQNSPRDPQLSTADLERVLASYNR